MNKLFFAEPEMEVVRFNAEIVTATSGCNDYTPGPTEPEDCDEHTKPGSIF